MALVGAEIDSRDGIEVVVGLNYAWKKDTIVFSMTIIIKLCKLINIT